MIKTAFISVDGNKSEEEIAQEIDAAIFAHDYTKISRGKVVSVSYCSAWRYIVAWDVRIPNCPY